MSPLVASIRMCCASVAATISAPIQVIPHVTDAIKEFVLSNHEDEDFIICEIGGTVGDIIAALPRGDTPVGQRAGT